MWMVVKGAVLCQGKSMTTPSLAAIRVTIIFRLGILLFLRRCLLEHRVEGLLLFLVRLTLKLLPLLGPQILQALFLCFEILSIRICTNEAFQKFDLCGPN